jgi:hypothetical protein
LPTQPAPAEQPLPDCTSPAALTPSMTEGPYYKPDSPERTSLLEADTPGTPLFLTGYVLNQDCQPVANAWLDFWRRTALAVRQRQATRCGHRAHRRVGSLLPRDGRAGGSIPGAPPISTSKSRHRMGPS